MSTAPRRILVVGPCDSAIKRTIERLASHGWRCQVVDLLAEAKEALKKSEYEIVLAAEYMPDGRGYDLTDIIARSSSSLFVGVMLSDRYLWLPTVERGLRTLGMRAVNPAMLEETMEDMLPHSALAAAAGGTSDTPMRAERHRHNQTVPPRRKSA
jgi:DNA-binding NtrC family response regulator